MKAPPAGFSSLQEPRANAIFRFMQTVELAEAQRRLAELIDKLVPGDEIIIERGQKPVARLTSTQAPAKLKRQFGSAKGKIMFHDGWDDPCEDFAPYTK